MLNTNFAIKYSNVAFGGSCHIQRADNEIGMLNHNTWLFREPETDEAVQKYLIKNFGNKDKINIVSAGCSSGEEAYSYAVMLEDELGEKLHITGFDVDPDSVVLAKSGLVEIMHEESFLTDDTSKLSPYKEKAKSRFHKYFTPPPQYTPSLDKNSLFQLNEGALKTKLDFKTGNIKNLEGILPEGEKADLFLMRNVLYHIVGYKKSLECNQIVDGIFGQVNKTLNKGGLLVLNESDRNPYASELMQKGFEPVIFDKTTKNEAKLDNPETLASRANVWRKVRDIDTPKR